MSARPYHAPGGCRRRRYFTGVFRDEVRLLRRELSWHLTLITLLLAEMLSILIRNSLDMDEQAAKAFSASGILKIAEERRQRREADYRRLAAARQHEQDTELERERAGHRGRVGQIVERGKRIPTHAEMREQEEQDRRGLQIYYASLFAERDIAERGRGKTQEVER